MLIDTRRLDEGVAVEADICIIGGGMAGLAMGLELSRQGVATVVLESGGHQADNQTRDLNRGESVGIPYGFADGCRSRFLGGSSNCWGGWCRPFSPQDFETRAWVPHSGWPIGLRDMEPFYQRAHRVLRLGPMEYDPEYWVRAINRPEVSRFPLGGMAIEDVIAQFSPPVRMGIDHRTELDSSSHLRVYLFANVVDIESCPEARTVNAVRVQTLSGRNMSVNARQFVLASGGIENARLLLACNRRAAAGLGNAHDLVGRYYMDHPRITWGRVELNPAYRSNRFHDFRYHYHNPAFSAHGTCIAGQFAPTQQAQQDEELLNSSMWFHSELPGEHNGPGQALTHAKAWLLRKDKPETSLMKDFAAVLRHPIDTAGYVAGQYFPHPALMRRMWVRTIVEPTPDPASRVTLSTERDQLQMPRVRVDWRLDHRVRHTFQRTAELLKESLEASGAARVTLDPPIEDGEWPATFEREGTWHHMGTTRMHESPRQGVVDPNCRVHGMNNLFVAGSSVFPTVGANLPTLTLVALALRLTDHLIAELKAPLTAG